MADGNKITYELAGEAIVRFVSTNAIPGPRGEKGEKGDKGDSTSLIPGSGIAITGTTIAADGTIARISDLASKADTTAVSSALATKADSSTVTTALASKASSADLTTGLAGKAAVNHTHDWLTITSRPTVAQINDALASSTSLYSASKIVSDLAAGLATKAAASHTHPWADITGKPTLAAVATTGDYNDLINKPTGSSGAGINDAAASSTTTYSSTKINALDAGKANVSHTHALADIVGLGDGAIFDGSSSFSSGNEVSLPNQQFSIVRITNVSDNNIGTWDAANSILTISKTGYYFSFGLLRLVDYTSSGSSLGLGIHTANEDNPKFFWQSTGAAQRQGALAIRIGKYNAGDQVRLITYPQAAQKYMASALTIFPIAAATVASMSGSGGSVISDSASATTTTYSSAKIEALVTAINNAIGGKANTSHTHSASDIVAGVLDAARLPQMSYTTLANLPTLGTIASQPANNVTITGGTITNTTIDASNAVKAPSLTRASINSAASGGTLVAGRVYIISDENRIAIASSTSAYTAY